MAELTAASPPLTPEMLWNVDLYREQGVYFYLEETEELLPTAASGSTAGGAR